MKLLSIIVPCYNEEASLPLFLPAIRETAARLGERHGLSCEELFIDDGSRDGTLELLRGFAACELAGLSSSRLVSRGSIWQKHIWRPGAGLSIS